MQTFLPYAEFQKTAECLDYKRLGKQRVETMQIMNTLSGKSGGWSNHPATLMWEGYEWALLQYQIAIVKEWVARGYKDNVCLEKTYNSYSLIESCHEFPPWLGKEEVHSSHRSNLLRKDYDYYCRFGWEEPDTIEYWWPSKHVGTIGLATI